jgi:hypothetical protein
MPAPTVLTSEFFDLQRQVPPDPRDLETAADRTPKCTIELERPTHRRVNRDSSDKSGNTYAEAAAGMMNRSSASQPLCQDGLCEGCLQTIQLLVHQIRIARADARRAIAAESLHTLSLTSPSFQKNSTPSIPGQGQSDAFSAGHSITAPVRGERPNRPAVAAGVRRAHIAPRHERSSPSSGQYRRSPRSRLWRDRGHARWLPEQNRCSAVGVHGNVPG